ncbi:unnamed protein product, partial [Discosporangium mesarthrocarpum]
MLSSWWIVIRDRIQDVRGAETLKFSTDTISPEEYASSTRSTMMTKRGLIKHDCTRLVALSSRREVAVPVWDGDPLGVFVNSTVMSKVSLLTRGKGQGQGRCHSDRNLESGERAFLVRCPSTTPRTIQPVTLTRWDEWAIGVHPAMCSPLKLDFDGGEVHLFPVCDNVSIEE